MARWLTRSGLTVAPLHVSSQSGELYVCPPGGTVPRAAALLAEACGLAPGPEYAGGWDKLEGLRRDHDVVVVEAPEVPAGLQALALRLTPEGIAVDGFGCLPVFGQDLTPPCDPDVAALPDWRFGLGPRVGIASLPHIANFADFRLFGGSEWLTLPGVGRFGLLFVPATANEAYDLEWLEETGLAEWLKEQREAGARLVSCSWQPYGAERMEAGELANYRVASRLIGHRLNAPLPAEETLDELADWFATWPGLDQWVRGSLGVPVVE